MVEIKSIYEGILTGLHAEPPLKTMNKKLIINVAPTGAFTSRQQNPLQPYTMEENVKSAIEAHKAGADVGLCGQAPSDQPEFAGFLVECGIDSMSVSPDSFIAVKRRVATAEQTVLSDIAE